MNSSYFAHQEPSRPINPDASSMISGAQVQMHHDHMVPGYRELEPLAESGRLNLNTWIMLCDPKIV